jgi:hypothetical protein
MFSKTIIVLKINIFGTTGLVSVIQKWGGQTATSLLVSLA